MANVPLMFYISMLHSSLGYPSGAPADKCETMGPPEHGAFAQIVDPPYSITTSSKRYNCGERMLGNFTLWKQGTLKNETSLLCFTEPSNVFIYHYLLVSDARTTFQRR